MPCSRQRSETEMPVSFCLSIAMIWLSEYRDVFIKNPFGSVYENALLLTAIKYRRDYSPFAIGRKNWMFSNSQKGAKARAMLYSIIETAKSNYLNPHAYLQLLFTKMPLVKSIEEYEQLLLWNAKELVELEV
jgi:hypothetical protein